MSIMLKALDTAGFPYRRNAKAEQAAPSTGGQRFSLIPVAAMWIPTKVSSSLLALGADSGTLCRSRFHLRVFLSSPLR
jgi:hypothetical protein